MFLFVRVLLLAALIATAIWAWEERSMRSFGVFLTSLAGFIGAELKVRAGHGKQDDRLLADRQLFARLREAMPTDSIHFLKTHDFGASFRIQEFIVLDRFQLSWDAADHIFHDRILEGQRRRLVKLVRALAWEIATNTWSAGEGSQGVPHEWAHEQPERLEKVRDSLNQKSSKVAALAEDLIKTGKKRLHV